MARKKSLGILECTREHPKVREIFLPKLESEREREREGGKYQVCDDYINSRCPQWQLAHVPLANIDLHMISSVCCVCVLRTEFRRKSKNDTETAVCDTSGIHLFPVVHLLEQ